MARGRLGGTKSKIRGKVGEDVYQMRRDPDGQLYQMVYSYTPNPANPNTEAQARARCIMGLIQRMWHWLPDIIKSAYADTPQGALSFQRFSHLNYSQVAADFDINFDGGNEFDWQDKRQMHAPAGPWYLTNGTLPPVTWDEAVFSLGWNNGLELAWNDLTSSQTYGDFLQCFSLQHGDTLILCLYRVDDPHHWGYVETFRFKPREEYAADLPWDYVDDEHVFVSDCPYRVTASQVWGENAFTLDIDTQDYPNRIKIACFAMFVVRPSEHGSLFSSSQFVWAQRNVSDGYRRTPPRDIWNSWFNG